MSAIAIGAFGAKPGVTTGIIVVISSAIVLALTVCALRVWKGTSFTTALGR